jgi:hypothetical protein
MSKRFHAFAFGVGLMVLGWVGWGFVGASWLALAMTAVIAAVYLLGAFELKNFRAATATLDAALRDLTQPPTALAEWLERVPPTLRNAVRMRVEGERVGLPGPALTPYLVGLLVMLGMLGTFLGMVVTFKGAVFALEGSTDLNTIRAALAAPIKGLGLSFGTSVAGVAASAMLGLMAAISRRERLEVARLLDTRVATVLLPFSQAFHRQETFRALQSQAEALPRLVDSLQAMMERIEERSDALDRQLLERHAQLQRDVTQAYGGLADRVGASLQESAGASARAAGDAIRPVVEGAMARITEQSERMQQRVVEQSESMQQRVAEASLRTQERVADIAQQQVDTLGKQFSASGASLAEGFAQALRELGQELQGEWRRVGDETLAAQQAVCRTLEQSAGDISRQAGTQAARTLESVARLVEQSEELVRARTESEAGFTEQHGARMDELAALWRSELAALREQEDRRGAAAVERLVQLESGAVERLGGLEAAVGQHLATLGAALEAPITRLLQTASEVPQAAAGVITQLREEMQRIGERDNLALQERTVLLEQFATLLQALQQASGEQRAAIDALVACAAAVLQDAGARFGEALQAQGGQVGEVAAQVTASAVELASVAEAFGASVQQFQSGNDKLTASLQSIEASLVKSTARSDEQLAYYVAQAREVIDLSIASQQGLMENLRALQAKAPKAKETLALADEAAG